MEVSPGGPEQGQDAQSAEEFIAEQKRQFRKRCDGGEGAGCYEFARLQVSADKDWDAAFQTLSHSCNDLRHHHSCAALAAMYEQGEGCTQDKAKAGKLYSRACDMGSRSACHTVAVELLDSGRPRDEAKGMRMLDEQCEKYDMIDSCFAVAMRLLQRGPSQDPARSERLLRKGCDDGHIESCHNLSVMYLRGDDGVARDKAKFVEYAERREELEQDPRARTLFRFEQQRRTHPDLYSDVARPDDLSPKQEASV